MQVPVYFCGIKECYTGMLNQQFKFLSIITTRHIIMSKESIIQAALAPFLNDAEMTNAMVIFHTNYVDITPYQIQRFVHEITQQEPIKSQRSEIRRSLMAALNNYQHNSLINYRDDTTVPVQVQRQEIPKELAAFESLVDSFLSQFSAQLQQSILQSVNHEVHQHHKASRDFRLGILGRKVKSNHALSLNTTTFFDGFFYGDRQSALTMPLTNADIASLRHIMSLFYLQACHWAGPSDADIALAQANKVAKGKFNSAIIERFM